MISLLAISKMVINSFFMASILNLTITKQVFHLDFKTIQNWIGLVFIIGFGLYIASGLIWVTQSWTDTAFSNTYGIRSFRNGIEHSLYNFFVLMPYLVFLLNSLKQLRTKKLIVCLTLLYFFPAFLEFCLVYFTGDVTLATINRVYLNPILQIIVIGPVLYFSIIILKKRLDN